MKKTIIKLSVLVATAGLAYGTQISIGRYCFDVAGACASPGNGTPVAIPNDGGTPLEGTITGSGLAPALSGRDLVLRLYGLQHGWSGDLVIQISRIFGDIVETAVTAPVFDRINLPNVGPLGSSSDFDTFAIILSNQGTNVQRPFYEFRVDAFRNLWAYAEFFASGDTDVILSNLSFAPSDGGDGAINFWTAFDGLDPNGKWRITIRDMAAGDEFDAGFIQGFELLLDTPEPATWALVIGALGALAARRQRAI